tara:strand:- start:128 stop:520 length:393 start_codon:yes stop_codon:yes gene_type:complete
MKTKITLIAGKIDKTISYSNDKYFMVYLDDDKNFPSRYLTNSGVDDCIGKIFSDSIKISKNWAVPILADVRTVQENKETVCEIVYTCYMPAVSKTEKSGKFYSRKQLDELDVKVEPYYVQVISKQAKSVY